MFGLGVAVQSRFASVRCSDRGGSGKAVGKSSRQSSRKKQPANSSRHMPLCLSLISLAHPSHQVHALIADPSAGSIAQLMPFQRGLPLTSA